MTLVAPEFHVRVHLRRASAEKFVDLLKKRFRFLILRLLDQKRPLLPQQLGLQFVEHRITVEIDRIGKVKSRII